MGYDSDDSDFSSYSDDFSSSSSSEPKKKPARKPPPPTKLELPDIPGVTDYAPARKSSDAKPKPSSEVQDGRAAPPEAPPSEVKVSVLHRTGEEVLTVRSSDTLASLRKRLGEALGAAAVEDVVHRGSVLKDDNAAMSACGVGDGAVLVVEPFEKLPRMAAAELARVFAVLGAAAAGYAAVAANAEPAAFRITGYLRRRIARKRLELRAYTRAVKTLLVLEAQRALPAGQCEYLPQSVPAPKEGPAAVPAAPQPPPLHIPLAAAGACTPAPPRLPQPPAWDTGLAPPPGGVHIPLRPALRGAARRPPAVTVGPGHVYVPLASTDAPTTEPASAPAPPPPPATALHIPLASAAGPVGTAGDASTAALQHGMFTDLAPVTTETPVRPFLVRMLGVLLAGDLPKGGDLARLVAVLEHDPVTGPVARLQLQPGAAGPAEGSTAPTAPLALGRLLVLGDVRGDLAVVRRVLRLPALQVLGAPAGGSEAEKTGDAEAEAGGDPSALAVLFNGGFIGDGAAGVAVALALLCARRLSPARVHLARGACEDGGHAVVHAIAPRYGSACAHAVVQRLRRLPLVHVVNERVCVAHSGVPPQAVDLAAADPDALAQLAPHFLRSEPSDTLATLHSAANAGGGGGNGGPPAGGLSFTRPVVETFLKANNLTAFVRGHTPPRCPAPLDFEQYCTAVPGGWVEEHLFAKPAPAAAEPDDAAAEAPKGPPPIAEELRKLRIYDRRVKAEVEDIANKEDEGRMAIEKAEAVGRPEFRPPPFYAGSKAKSPMKGGGGRSPEEVALAPPAACGKKRPERKEERVEVGYLENCLHWLPRTLGRWRTPEELNASLDPLARGSDLGHFLRPPPATAEEAQAESAAAAEETKPEGERGDAANGTAAEEDAGDDEEKAKANALAEASQPPARPSPGTLFRAAAAAGAAAAAVVAAAASPPVPHDGPPSVAMADLPAAVQGALRGRRAGQLLPAAPWGQGGLRGCTVDSGYGRHHGGLVHTVWSTAEHYPDTSAVCLMLSFVPPPEGEGMGMRGMGQTTAVDVVVRRKGGTGAADGATLFMTPRLLRVPDVPVAADAAAVKARCRGLLAPHLAAVRAHGAASRGAWVDMMDAAVGSPGVLRGVGYADSIPWRTLWRDLVDGAPAMMQHGGRDEKVEAGAATKEGGAGFFSGAPAEARPELADATAASLPCDPTSLRVCRIRAEDVWVDAWGRLAEPLLASVFAEAFHTRAQAVLRGGAWGGLGFASLCAAAAAALPPLPRDAVVYFAMHFLDAHYPAGGVEGACAGAVRRRQVAAKRVYRAAKEAEQETKKEVKENGADGEGAPKAADTEGKGHPSPPAVATVPRPAPVSPPTERCLLALWVMATQRPAAFRTEFLAGCSHAAEGTGERVIDVGAFAEFGKRVPLYPGGAGQREAGVWCVAADVLAVQTWDGAAEVPPGCISVPGLERMLFEVDGLLRRAPAAARGAFTTLTHGAEALVAAILVHGVDKAGCVTRARFARACAGCLPGTTPFEAGRFWEMLVNVDAVAQPGAPTRAPCDADADADDADDPAAVALSRHAAASADALVGMFDVVAPPAPAVPRASLSHRREWRVCPTLPARRAGVAAALAVAGGAAVVVGPPPPLPHPSVVGAVVEAKELPQGRFLKAAAEEAARRSQVRNEGALSKAQTALVSGGEAAAASTRYKAVAVAALTPGTTVDARFPTGATVAVGFRKAGGKPVGGARRVWIASLKFTTPYPPAGAAAPPPPAPPADEGEAAPVPTTVVGFTRKRCGGVWFEYVSGRPSAAPKTVEVKAVKFCAPAGAARRAEAAGCQICVYPAHAAHGKEGDGGKVWVNLPQTPTFAASLVRLWLFLDGGSEAVKVVHNIGLQYVGADGVLTFQPSYTRPFRHPLPALRAALAAAGEVLLTKHTTLQAAAEALAEQGLPGALAALGGASRDASLRDKLRTLAACSDGSAQHLFDLVGLIPVVMPPAGRPAAEPAPEPAPAEGDGDDAEGEPPYRTTLHSIAYTAGEDDYSQKLEECLAKAEKKARTNGGGAVSKGDYVCTEDDAERTGQVLHVDKTWARVRFAAAPGTRGGAQTEMVTCEKLRPAPSAAVRTRLLDELGVVTYQRSSLGIAKKGGLYLLGPGARGTPLQYACLALREHMVKWLLRHNANPFLAADADATPRKICVANRAGMLERAQQVKNDADAMQTEITAAKKAEAELSNAALEAMKASTEAGKAAASAKSNVGKLSAEAKKLDEAAKQKEEEEKKAAAQVAGLGKRHKALLEQAAGCKTAAEKFQRMGASLKAAEAAYRKGNAAFPHLLPGEERGTFLPHTALPDGLLPATVVNRPPPAPARGDGGGLVKSYVEDGVVCLAAASLDRITAALRKNAVRALDLSGIRVLPPSRVEEETAWSPPEADGGSTPSGEALMSPATKEPEKEKEKEKEAKDSTAKKPAAKKRTRSGSSSSSSSSSSYSSVSSSSTAKKKKEATEKAAAEAKAEAEAKAKAQAAEKEAAEKTDAEKAEGADGSEKEGGGEAKVKPPTLPPHPLDAFFDALAENTSLKELNLRCCGVTAASACRLARAVAANTSLQGLFLWKNPIGAASPALLHAVRVANKTLRTLDLTATGMTWADCEAARALQRQRKGTPHPVAIAVDKVPPPPPRTAEPEPEPEAAPPQRGDAFETEEAAAARAEAARKSKWQALAEEAEAQEAAMLKQKAAEEARVAAAADESEAKLKELERQLSDSKNSSDHGAPRRRASSAYDVEEKYRDAQEGESKAEAAAEEEAKAKAKALAGL